MMNRLWVRISLAIMVVVIFATLIPMIIGIAVREFQYQGEPVAPPPEPPDLSGLTPEEQEAIMAKHRPFPGKFVLDNITPLLISVTILGVSVGAILSHGLSAPLSRLAEAARAIGERDLSQRVEISGTQEVREVASAFNEMAATLEQAEILRRNLLADVAHELRTPISVIQGNLQAILDDVFQLDKREIARLFDQTRQLARLVDDLGDLAQAEAHQLPIQKLPVDMAVLISRESETYAPMAEAAGITFQTHSQAENAIILGDRDRLVQCLGNLLTNAFRHTPEGGSVTVSLTSDPQWLTIQVQDSGTGITPEHLPHIFDRFYRTDPARSRASGGSGLGLAITRALITTLGGEIEAESPGAGLGSTFRIRLPLLHTS
jgi:signal transduction histidine kinase